MEEAGGRKPMGYWDPFNHWWRDFVAKNDKRPNVKEMKAWYDAHATNAWGNLGPTWEETKKHSKGMRRLEDIPNYFRKYRKGRKSRSGRGGEEEGGDESSGSEGQHEEAAALDNDAGLPAKRARMPTSNNAVSAGTRSPNTAEAVEGLCQLQRGPALPPAPAPTTTAPTPDAVPALQLLTGRSGSQRAAPRGPGKGQGGPGTVQQAYYVMEQAPVLPPPTWGAKPFFFARMDPPARYAPAPAPPEPAAPRTSAGAPNGAGGHASHGAGAAAGRSAAPAAPVAAAAQLTAQPQPGQRASIQSLLWPAVKQQPAPAAAMGTAGTVPAAQGHTQPQQLPLPAQAGPGHAYAPGPGHVQQQQHALAQQQQQQAVHPVSVNGHLQLLFQSHELQHAQQMPVQQPYHASGQPLQQQQQYCPPGALPGALQQQQQYLAHHHCQQHHNQRQDAPSPDLRTSPCAAAGSGTSSAGYARTAPVGAAFQAQPQHMPSGSSMAPPPQPPPAPPPPPPPPHQPHYACPAAAAAAGEGRAAPTPDMSQFHAAPPGAAYATDPIMQYTAHHQRLKQEPYHAPMELPPMPASLHWPQSSQQPHQQQQQRGGVLSRLAPLNSTLRVVRSVYSLWTKPSLEPSQGGPQEGPQHQGTAPGGTQAPAGGLVSVLAYAGEAYEQQQQQLPALLLAPQQQYPQYHGQQQQHEPPCAASPQQQRHEAHAGQALYAAAGAVAQQQQQAAASGSARPGLFPWTVNTPGPKQEQQQHDAPPDAIGYITGPILWREAPLSAAMAAPGAAEQQTKQQEQPVVGSKRQRDSSTGDCVSAGACCSGASTVPELAASAPGSCCGCGSGSGASAAAADAAAAAHGDASDGGGGSSRKLQRMVSGAWSRMAGLTRRLSAGRRPANGAAGGGSHAPAAPGQRHPSEGQQEGAAALSTVNGGALGLPSLDLGDLASLDLGSVSGLLSGLDSRLLDGLDSLVAAADVAAAAAGPAVAQAQPERGAAAQHQGPMPAASQPKPPCAARRGSECAISVEHHLPTPFVACDMQRRAAARSGGSWGDGCDAVGLPMSWPAAEADGQLAEWHRQVAAAAVAAGVAASAAQGAGCSQRGAQEQQRQQQQPGEGAGEGEGAEGMEAEGGGAGEAADDGDDGAGGQQGPGPTPSSGSMLFFRLSDTVSSLLRGLSGSFRF